MPRFGGPLGPMASPSGGVRVSFDVAKMAVEAAMKAGADYADARTGTDEVESLTVRNQEMEGIDRSSSSGVGVRVLAGGRWGFASTSRQDGSEVVRTAELAVEIANAASRRPGDPVSLSPLEPVVATWRGPVEEDPFIVLLEEKVALLMEATRRMQTVPGVTFAEAGLDLFRRSTWFASSEGAAIDQVVVHSGGGIEATAVAEGDVQRRSYPNSFRGHIKGAGWEHVRTLGLIEEAERTGREAVELLAAPECPSEVTTLVLDSGQVELQVHESIGHPIELDRVLGMEEAYAGSSFLTPSDRGTLRYGSPLVSVTADATLSGGLGSFGFDDEGVPAQRVPIIEDGVFQNFLTSRETSGVVGQTSNGTSRADGWSHLPLIRMTNISLEPREGSLAEILGDTKDGIYMATNQSWSIDDKRINFQFGCEIAWRIKDGRLTQLYKNPNYTGITPEFWGSCDAVGGREGWTVWGTPNCGKGQPGQVGRVGHGTAPARFRDVQVGVR
jgi:TldD protein